MDIGKLSSGAGLLLALAAVAGGARAQDAPLRIEHAAARVVVIPEARGTLSVSVQHGPSRLPQLQVRQEGGRIVVDGGLLEHGLFGGPVGGHERARCVGGLQARRFFGGRPLDTRAVVVEQVGRVAYADLPVITVHAPMNVRLAASSAVYGGVGRSDSASLSLTGCGDWTVADVRGQLAADLIGSGDLRASRAGTLNAHLAGSGDLSTTAVDGAAEVQVAGSGDVSTGAVGGGLTVQLSGSGDVAAARVSGPVRAAIAASGDVRIHAGHASSAEVHVAGSGDFVFDGTADSLSASVVGSGDVRVAHVTGPVSKSVLGSGEISVGR